MAPGAHAQTNMCQIVARDLWSNVATAPLREQTPLVELTAAGLVHTGSHGLTKPGQSIADALIKDHAADEALVRKLRDQPPTEATRFGDSDMWLLDRVEGTLGCHTATTVAVSVGAPAHEVGLPVDLDPTALCGLSAMAAVSINGDPALWIEQSGAFSNLLAQSKISIAALRETSLMPPCSLTVEYALADQATHAFCDGVDCVPLIRTAEILAMRLRQDESADTLGAGAIRGEEDGANYRRMFEIGSKNQAAAELPTFGVSLNIPYLSFADQVTFPLRLEDDKIYLARMGHGGFGWRQTADTLLALYRLHDDEIVPAASVYIGARRTGIVGVAVQ
jgi:hypothetical protein